MGKRIKLRLFLWILLVFIFIVLLWLSISPGGHIAYKHNFEKKNYFISKIRPAERLSGDNKIIGDPVYFNLRTQRKFNKASLELKYHEDEMEKGQEPISLIELGVLVDGKNWRYKMKPVENKMLDTLEEKWERKRNGNMLLLERPGLASSTPKYGSIDEFISNPPNPDEIALYNYSLASNFVLKGYEPKNETYIIDVPLRGAYQLFTYIKNENINYKFLFSDLNKNKDSDKIEIFVYYNNNNLIKSYLLEDDGIRGDTGEESNFREQHVLLENLPEGAYKVEVRANDDIITNRIITKNYKTSFLNKIWLWQTKKENFKLFMTGRELGAQTTNPGSLQKIGIGGKKIDINETFKMFRAKLASSSNAVLVPKSDVILSGNGVFGFWENSIFDPRFKKVDSLFDPADEKVNYILANYNKPDSHQGEKTAEAEFNLSGAVRENGIYGFIISIPGFGNEKGRQSIVLDRVKIDLYGVSLAEKVKTFVGSLLGNKK